MEEIERVLKENPFSGFDCPCCWRSFETRAEKAKHMELMHGYEPLHIGPRKRWLHWLCCITGFSFIAKDGWRYGVTLNGD